MYELHDWIIFINEGSVLQVGEVVGKTDGRYDIDDGDYVHGGIHEDDVMGRVN